MNRRTMTVAGVACAALLIAWFLLLWSPKGADIKAAKAKETTAESKVAELQSKLDRLQAAVRETPQLQADLERVESAIPASANLPQFILDADDVASRTGVEFLSITPSPPAIGTGGPAEVKLSIIITGEYQPVLAYFDELLRLRRLVVVDGVSVKPDTADGALSLSVAIDARMFTSAAPAAPTEAAR